MHNKQDGKMHSKMAAAWLLRGSLMLALSAGSCVYSQAADDVAQVKPAPAPQGELSPQANYVLRCLGCHRPDGAGSPVGGIPDFNNYVASFAETERGREYLMHVPGVVGASLSDNEIAEVMNYIMQRWGGTSLRANFQPFSAEEVARLRQTDVGDVVKYRRIVVAELQAMGLPVADYPWP